MAKNINHSHCSNPTTTTSTNQAPVTRHVVHLIQPRAHLTSYNNHHSMPTSRAHLRKSHQVRLETQTVSEPPSTHHYAPRYHLKSAITPYTQHLPNLSPSKVEPPSLGSIVVPTKSQLKTKIPTQELVHHTRSHHPTHHIPHYHDRNHEPPLVHHNYEQAVHLTSSFSSPNETLRADDTNL